MKTLLIEVPDGWSQEREGYRYVTMTRHEMTEALANAKEAVEVKCSQELMSNEKAGFSKKPHIFSQVSEFVPVTLYAVKREEM